MAALALQLEVLNQEHLILCARDDAPSTEREMGVASKPLRFVHLATRAVRTVLPVMSTALTW